MPQPSRVSEYRNLLPEEELLLSVGRQRIAPERVEEVRELARRNGLDWGYFLRLAKRHKMMPICYTGLTAALPGCVPEPVLESLLSSFHANTGRNLLLAFELVRILRALREGGIEAIPFKGPTLAVMAYGGLSFRECGDLDILLQEGDLSKGTELVEALGYQANTSWVEKAWGPGAGKLRAHLDYNRAFLPCAGGPVIELHWAFAEQHYGFRPESDALWGHRREVSLAGATVPVFGPEHTLLILSVHGTRHRWERLSWIDDIAELIRSHPDLEWGRVFDEARAHRIQRMVGLGLRLARDLLGATLPAEANSHVEADRLVRSLARRVPNRLFDLAPRPNLILTKPIVRDGTTLSEAHFDLLVRDRTPDRLRYLTHLVRLGLTPTVEERRLLPLPEPLVFLHPYLRPIRVLVAGCLRWFRHGREAP